MFPDRKKIDISFIDSAKQVLSSEGTCLIPKSNLFLRLDQWKTLNNEARKLEYKKISVGDTAEPLSFQVSRIKLPSDNNIKHKIIYDIVDFYPKAGN